MSDRFDERVENIRQAYLMVGEAMDAWRVLPRMVVIMYMWWMVDITDWFMALEPVFDRANCIEKVCKVLIDGPTTQHTAMVMGVIGLAAGIFGFYLQGGRNWETGIYSWKHMINPNLVKREEEEPDEDVTTAVAAVVTKAQEVKSPVKKRKPAAKVTE